MASDMTFSAYIPMIQTSKVHKPSPQPREERDENFAYDTITLRHQSNLTHEGLEYRVARVKHPKLETFDFLKFVTLQPVRRQHSYI